MKKMFFAHLRTGISMSVIILLLAFNSTDSFFERLFFSLKKEVHQTINTVKLAALDEFAPGDVCNNLASNAIGGNVWEDHNADGDRSTETTVYGVAGIQVSLYDAQNQQIATVSTDADGNYLFSNLTESKYRVEFVIPNTIASYTNSTLAGVNSNSTVQFVAPGNCANLGLINPAQYCDEAPFLITPCYISGDPAAGGSSGIGDVLVSYPYAAGATKSDVNPLALNKDIGTTWGIAYERTGQTSMRRP